MRRDVPLTAEESAWLEQHVARRRYYLTIAPEPNVLASGFEKPPWEPDDDEWQDLLVALTELRRHFPDAICEVSDTYESVYWDDDLDAYSNGMRDGVADLEDDDEEPESDEADAELESDEPEHDEVDLLIGQVDDATRGRLQLTGDATDGPIRATLEATLEGRDLTVDVRLRKAIERLEVTGVRLVARAADGAPYLSKVLGSPLGDRLYVSENFADIACSFELFAIVRHDVNELVASYDAKAVPAPNGSLAPIELAPRTPPPGIGIELSSIVGWTVSEYSDQEIKLFVCAKATNELVYNRLSLVFKLLDDTGTELHQNDGVVRLPIEHVQARTGQLPERTITALRRIDVFAKGPIEGQLSLGCVRIVRARS
ncbi:MAG: hypothetical protein HOV81_15270 [Kofleriaceae bacterium]|nr:hypothetical protein [Kofleriaceae bacterium]